MISFDKIIVRGKTIAEQTVILKITLINKNGSAFAATIPVTDNFRDIELSLSDFKPDSALLMPRPYPGFQPLYFKSSATNEVFGLDGIEKIEITTTPSLHSSNSKDYSFEIESVRLGKRK